MLKTVSSITNAIGALNYKGTWNASTNTPTITSSVGVKGDYYVVSVGGTTNINGISNWGVGDWITFNGSVWQRVEGGADLNGVNLSVSGTTTLSGLTASTALALDASKNVVSVTNTGTGDNVLGTSPTMTTPRVVTSLNDTNGNELFGITATASAVNEITVANAATGNAPALSATGSDTNISIGITPKGNGAVILPAGAVGTPILSTTGDTDTGIYFSAADTVAIATGGSQGGRFVASGYQGSLNFAPGTNFPQTSTSGTDTSIVDTGIFIPTNGLTCHEVFIRGNPSSANLGEIRFQGLFYVRTAAGWTGSAVRAYITTTQTYLIQVQGWFNTMTFSAVFWDGSTEATDIAIGSVSSNQIRIKIGGYSSGVQGGSQQVRMRRIFFE